MMTATGKLQALEISRDGAPITVLDQRRGAFTLNGQSYNVRPISAFLARSYELRRGDEVLAFAKSVPFVNRTAVSSGGKTWLLKAENFRATRFGLYDGATRLGGIASGDWFRPWNGATIDMADTLPLDVQMFLTSVVLFKWAAANSA